MLGSQRHCVTGKAERSFLVGEISIRRDFDLAYRGDPMIQRS